MKNKIIIILLFSFLIPIHFSFAILYPAGFGTNTGTGSQYDPIYIQVVPNIRSTNTEKENNLINTYGYSAYNSCRYSLCKDDDVGNPYTKSSCLKQVESWLRMGYCKVQQESTLTTVGNCSNNLIYYNSECITPEQFIQQRKQKNEKTISPILPYGCISEEGYSLTSGVPCGEVSSAKSTITCNGKEWLSCPEGGTFYCPPDGDAECVPKEKRKVIAPVTKEVSEVKIQDKTKEVISIDTKINSEEVKKVITASTEDTKPKSFWKRLKKWFGF